jgi:DNA-binding CsgD family transcriptional regulator
MDMKQNISQTVRQIHSVINERQQAYFLYAQTRFTNYQQSFEFVQQLFPSWVVMLCGIYNDSAAYVGENCQEIFGYSSQQMCSFSIEEAYAHVHPDDQLPMSRVMEHLLHLTKAVSYDALRRYRFISNYRYRHANGKYFHLHDEKLVLRNKDGKYLHITLFKDISKEKPFTQVKLEISKLVENAYRKVEEYVPVLHHQPITRREREILQLIQHGQSNKEIADRLCISEHTARNHRSNLFEKAKARNVIELLNNAKAMQWI